MKVGYNTGVGYQKDVTEASTKEKYKAEVESRNQKKLNEQVTKNREQLKADSDIPVGYQKVKYENKGKKVDITG